MEVVGGERYETPEGAIAGVRKRIGDLRGSQVALAGALCDLLDAAGRVWPHVTPSQGSVELMLALEKAEKAIGGRKTFAEWDRTSCPMYNIQGTIT